MQLYFHSLLYLEYVFASYILGDALNYHIYKLENTFHYGLTGYTTIFFMQPNYGY